MRPIAAVVHARGQRVPVELMHELCHATERTPSPHLGPFGEREQTELVALLWVNISGMRSSER
jgi:hypothetical protein